MGASWDHEYQIKSSIQSSISRGSITWQISGYESRNQVSLTCNTWLTIKPFNNKKWSNPSYPLKKIYYLWLSNLVTRISHPVTQISQPCCTDGLHLEKNSTRLKTAITDLPLQKRSFNKPASKLYIVSPGYEEGMKPAADFKITHGFIVFDTKPKVKLIKMIPA